MRRAKGRIAFALVIVLAIASSVVIKVRETTRYNECRANLRNLAIALQTYHGDYGSFPAGTIPNNTLPPERRLSWLVEVFPYSIGGVRPQLDNNEAWDSETNRDARLWGVKTKTDLGSKREDLQCPSNPVADSRPPVTHYVGIGGVGTDAASLMAGDPRVGVFGYDRVTAAGDIRDGTSTTMMVGETTSNNGQWTAGGPATVRGLDTELQPYVGRDRQFGGNHNGGCLTLFADGSVRLIKESVSPDIFEALATIAGDEEVSHSLNEFMNDDRP